MQYSKYKLPIIYLQDQLSTLARTMKATVNKSNIKDKLRYANQYLSKLKNLSQEVSTGTRVGEVGVDIPGVG